MGAGLCERDGDGLGGAGRAAFISFPSIGRESRPNDGLEQRKKDSIN